MFPSIKTIQTRLHLDRQIAIVVRGVLDGSISYHKIPGVSEWYRRFHHPPKTYQCKLEAINELIGGHGVEGFPDPDDMTASGLEYVNMGDTYTTTVVYWKGRYMITTWGDVVEGLERQGIYFT